MFGINGNNDGDDRALHAEPPMVPNSDGIDQPAHMMSHPPDDRTPMAPTTTISSAPPMPDGPAVPPPKPTIHSISGHPAPTAPLPPPPPPPPSPPADDLLKLKQEALHNLAPLVDHLEQTPEEKFKTTMMMLQASDNPVLVKEAYDAANAIKDDKVRAQALLDVVNEINYFTQHKNKN